MKSKTKVYLGCAAMLLAMIGDYLLGVNAIGSSTDPDALYGIDWNMVPDWRYALSSILGFISAALFAVAAVELMKVLERDYGVKNSVFYKLFKIANWGGILYFAFIHIGICMLPVVFNAGMDAVGDLETAVIMTLRVGKSIIIPLALGFIICDGFVTVGWIGMILKGQLPLPKIALICNPVIIMLLGQLLNFVPFPFTGVDSGFESLGWLLLYAVAAGKLVKEG